MPSKTKSEQVLSVDESISAESPEESPPFPNAVPHEQEYTPREEDEDVSSLLYAAESPTAYSPENFAPLALLKQYFGFDDFRAGQREVIEALRTQNAALAVFPTGGGKSICYQLPALSFHGLTVVVSPLIALMKDQIDYLKSKGIPAARLDSSLTLSEQMSVNNSIRENKLKLLYVAPERFNNERFLDMLKRVCISLFTIDEAHCISEWGHNFRPDYLKLAETIKAVRAERVLALTATATPEVVEDICNAIGIPSSAAILTGFYRSNLNLCFTPVTADTRDAFLLKRLKSRKPGASIIYVTLQKTAERVADMIRSTGLPAQAYHAGMDSEARTSVQEWWMREPNSIVVATIAFGMGIDKSDVRYIYHYNLPKSLESYSQEIGRAGRDYLKSTVEMLACGDDLPVLENFFFGDTPTETSIRRLVQEMLDGTHNSTMNEGIPGVDFDVSLYDISNRLDIRMLVLRTALTYLELLGAIKQGTPFYAGYDIRPLAPVEKIIRSFPGEPGHLVRDIFESSKKGKIWYGIEPAKLSERLSQTRRRIVRAVEVMEEREMVEVRASDVRQRYSRLREKGDVELLTAELMQRFEHREKQEIKRLAQVISLVTHDACQTNSLVGYFGEIRPEPCGHCSFCITGKQQALPDPVDPPSINSVVDSSDVIAVSREKSEALGSTRQLARFLCGISSPAVSRARLGKHSLFGILESHRFMDVLEWCRSKISV